MKRGNETILIIDDEEVILELAQTMLSKLGYRVLTAEDGEKGLEIYQNYQKKVDVVLIDLIMPKMHGTIVMEKLINMNPEWLARSKVHDIRYNSPQQIQDKLTHFNELFQGNPDDWPGIISDLREEYKKTRAGAT